MRRLWLAASIIVNALAAIFIASVLANPDNSVAMANRGPVVGWGKLERKATAEAGP